MAPNPIDDEELYEGIVLGGVRSPGKVTLSGHDRKIGWDVKKGSGQSGATTTLSDVPPVEFTATFYLVKDPTLGIDDLADWPAFLDVINSTVRSTTPKALDIYHPDLASQEIKSVVKATVMGTVHDGKGGQTIAVKFLEYLPPAKKGGTPSGSKSNAKKNAAPDPDAAALAELDKLLNEYKRTPAG